MKKGIIIKGIGGFYDVNWTMMFYGVMRGENSGKTVLFLWLAIRLR